MDAQEKHPTEGRSGQHRRGQVLCEPFPERQESGTANSRVAYWARVPGEVFGRKKEGGSVMQFEKARKAVRSVLQQYAGDDVLWAASVVTAALNDISAESG